MPAALIAILCLATLTLAVLAAAQARRRRQLATRAHGLGLKFSAEDPFELPQRCAAFSLMQAGHSAYADNVLYGRIGGWPLRAFDYRYEAGHGPQRLIRRHSVVAAETSLPWPAALSWRGDQARPDAPPAIDAQPWDQSWRLAGASGAAMALASAWGGGSGEPVCIEFRDGLVLFSRPGRLSGSALAQFVQEAARCLDRMERD